jgi:subtilase family protein
MGRFLGVLAISLLAPGSASAMPSGAGDLSSRLAELARPSLRSLPPVKQAARLGVPPAGPGSLLRRDGRVLAYVRFDRGALAGLDALRDAGAKIADVSRRYQTVTVASRPEALPSVAAVPGVAGVVEALAPVTAATCPSGDVVSEGLAQLRAGDSTGEAREVFSVDGSGIDVGILSDSFDQATQAVDGSGPVATTAPDDVASADLPGVGNLCGHTTPVTILESDKSGGGGPTDEGRAMAQIVHDLAPGSSLAFASAFNGETSFAKNIRDLATGGAEVIVDDVFYLGEPFFQDGPIAVAVNEVVAGGVAYFSAAGNDNRIDAEGHDVASWEAPAYRDANSCPQEVRLFPGAKGTHCMDFHPGDPVDRTFGVKVPAGTLLSIDLQWAEPWLGVVTDLDVFLLDASGELIAISTEDNVEISQKPVEVLQWTNESASAQTVQIVINRYAGGAPRLKLALLGNGAGVTATEYPRSTGEDVVGPTVFGHSGSASAISVGAVHFNDSSKPEGYSSRGPVRHEFGPVDGVKAADPLPAPEIISKPDLVATDCGLTTFFASLTPSGWRFCGTSAAAPHAAGVAALMLEEEAAATPSEVRTALQASAVPVGAFGPCAVGAGLIEAVGAIEDLLTPPVFTPPTCLPPAPQGSAEEAQAAGNWGSETPPSPSTPVIPQPAGATPTPVEADPPRTFIRLRPAKVVRTSGRTARVVFRFASDQADATFACRIDNLLFRACPERLVRRFPLGWHTIKVVARDAAGHGDRTPAFYRFRVKRVG